MGRIVIIVVVLLVAGLGTSFFLLPNTASRTETITLERPAATVFARLASTPPNTTLAEGVTITQVRSAEDNTVVADVAYADGGVGQVTYTVAEQGEGSTVQMRLERNLGDNPLARFTAIGGGPVSPVIEAATATVSADLEALPAAAFTGLAYSVVQVESRPFFYVQNCTPSDPDSITSIISDAVAGIPPIMRQRGLTQSGPLMAVEPRVVPGQYCFQVGYPFTGRAPASVLIGQIGQTPGGTLLRVVYTGTEADVLNQVYNPMDALLAAAHLDNPATPEDDWVTFEVYHDDPLQAGGSRNREIFYVVQGDISRLTAILAPSAAAPAQPAEAPAAAPAATPTPAPAPATTP